MPWWRYVLSWCLNAVTRRLLDLTIRDSSSGFRLYRRQAMLDLPMRAEDFSVQQEGLVQLLAHGGKAEEIPFFYEPRLGGESKADVGLLARRYLRMLWTLKGVRGGRSQWAALAAVLVLGIGVGLTGLGWGLPGPARLRVLPGGQRPTPEAAGKLAQGWEKLYADIQRTHLEMREEPANLFRGAGEFPPGWEFPPEKLDFSIRSMLLQTESPDEKKPFTNLARMRPWKLEFKPLYVSYGGAFLYPFGAFVAAGALGGVVRLVPGVAHYLQYPEDMGRLFLLGRVFVFLFHLAGLVLLFGLGCRLGGWGAGLCAAVFFALCPVAVENSHLIKPYAYATFWVLAASWLTVSAVRRGRRKDYLLGGFCAGMALGANLSLPVFVVWPLLAWGMRRWRGAAGEGEWRWASGAVLLAMAVFALSNPYLFLSYKDFAWELEVLSPQRLGFDSWRSLPSVPGASAAGMGMVVAVFGAAGLGWTLLRGNDDAKVLAAGALAGGSLIAARFPTMMSAAGFRLLHSVAALACLMAAVLLLRLPRGLRALVLAAALVDSGLRAAVVLENMRRDSTPLATRAQAAAWVDANVPAGSRVGLLRYPEPAHTPAFSYNRYHLVVFDGPRSLEGRLPPDYLVVDAAARQELETWGGDYEIVAQFPSWRAGWAPAIEGSSLANETFFVYRLRRRTGGLENGRASFASKERVLGRALMPAVASR